MLDLCPQKIVVFLPNWVGDVVMATPTLRALRLQMPEARIAYFGRPAALDVLGGTDWVDDMLVAKPKVKSRTIGLFQLSGVLRRGGFDVAILLTNSFRTALLARLAGIKRIVGYDRDARGMFLTDKLPPPRDDSGQLLVVSAVDYYAGLAAILEVAVESRRMWLPVTAGDEAAADEFLAEAGVDGAGPVVMLNPGASFGSSKMWGQRQFARAGDMLIEGRRAAVIINASPPERRIACAVADEMRNKPAINFGERDNTLGLLKSLLNRTELLITNDTGARHIGAAMGAAVVTVFGSTDPQWARIDYSRERIVKVDVPCGPCRQKVCFQPPGSVYHQCMEKITPQMVVHAAEELLDEPAERTEGVVRT
ncbi:MAG: lipopolysaccharide heptosyltransferase II [Phycisphaerae bacterium]|jgi:heptosyltransferase-2|nr:lipopolysaccharide heptosyltransferase II [Phycisphaerae bacterium]